MTEPAAILVLCTAPDADVGARLARELVEAKLVACVNIVPGLRSIYRWHDAIQDDAEVQLLIKTVASRFEDVRKRLRAAHPYEVPEVIAVPIIAADDAYLAWLRAQSEP